MFSNIVRINSRKNRRENSIYFSTLIISIIAFYIILSLEEQNVISFLKTIDSNSVGKLLNTILILYIVSIIIMFFLAYFANKYQMENRQKELGIYLILGINRRKLFMMILTETIINGIISLFIALPIGIFITELISLITLRIAGLSIINYSFSLSIKAIVFSIVGFIIIQILSVIILSFKFILKEPVNLIKPKKERIYKKSRFMVFNFLIGIIFLTISYILGVKYLEPALGNLQSGNIYYIILIAILIIGILGTYLFLKGLGEVLGIIIKKKSLKSKGLYIFTSRQIQENVLTEYISLTISSLLILISIISIILGISIMSSRQGKVNKVTDFTFMDYGMEMKDDYEENLERILDSKDLKPYIKNYYPVKTSSIAFPVKENGEELEEFKGEYEHTVYWGDILSHIDETKSIQYDDLANILKNNRLNGAISLSSYNNILHLNNKDKIELDEDEIAIYTNKEFMEFEDIWNEILKNNISIKIDGKVYNLKPKVYTDNIVADRSVSYNNALILNDELYNGLVDEPEVNWIWNVDLKDEIIKEKGLLLAILEVDGILENYDLDCESYLSSMGRSIFYTVTGSYISLYLGILFLLIANTVLAIKFLAQQKDTKYRYKIASFLGATNGSLKKSARKQIIIFFIISMTVALISSIFGTITLLKTFVGGINGLDMNVTRNLSVIIFILFIILETIYIIFIQKKSNRELDGILEDY